jgi:hypothetical protein
MGENLTFAAWLNRKKEKTEAKSKKLLTRIGLLMEGVGKATFVITCKLNCDSVTSPTTNWRSMRIDMVPVGDSKTGQLSRPLLVVLATDAVLAFRLFLTIHTEAVNIFYTDQWDFNEPVLFHPQPLWQAFRHQHGPHREGLGAFIGLAVGRLSHWNTRAEAFTIGIIVVVASLCALWLKKRLLGALTYWDAIIPMLFFTRVQWETFLGSTNPALGALPLLLIVVYALAWTCQRDLLRYSLILISNFLSIYTGYGLFLGFVTPPLLAIDAYQKARTEGHKAWYPVAACLLSVASLLSFFSGYVQNPNCFAFIHSHPASYVKFVMMMFSGFLAARGFYFSVVSGVIVFAILLVIVVNRLKRICLLSGNHRNLSDIVIALIAFSLVFSSTTAAGRICIEGGSGQTSRYMIYMVPAFLAIYFYALTLSEKLRTRCLAILLVLSLLASFPTGVAHKGTMQKARLEWRDCYLKLEDVDRCDEITNFSVYPRPEAVTHLQEKLQFLKQHRLNLYAR